MAVSQTLRTFEQTERRHYAVELASKLLPCSSSFTLLGYVLISSATLRQSARNRIPEGGMHVYQCFSFARNLTVILPRRWPAPTLPRSDSAESF